jgi:hypothetical protein
MLGGFTGFTGFGVFYGHLWSFCDHFVIILWSFCDHFVIILWSFCDHFAIIWYIYSRFWYVVPGKIWQPWWKLRSGICTKQNESSISYVLASTRSWSWSSFFGGRIVSANLLVAQHRQDWHFFDSESRMKNVRARDRCQCDRKCFGKSDQNFPKISQCLALLTKNLSSKELIFK